MYADVAVCLPLARTFVYRLNQHVEPGCRVVVPFRKREVEGFVIGFRKEAPADLEVHEIGSVLDAIPLVHSDIFRLCRWIADYYVTPIGEVLKAALPPGIKYSPPKLGGVPSEARRGGSNQNHPDCSDFFSGFALSGSRFAVLAGSPPNLGGELRVINSFTAS